MADVGKSDIKQLLSEIKVLSRKEIANECGVSIDALNAWIKNGKIPLVHWDKLLELKFSQVEKLNTSAAFLSLPILPKEKDLSIFTDKELIDEIYRRMKNR